MTTYTKNTYRTMYTQQMHNNNNNNNNPICKAPECQKTSVALQHVRKLIALYTANAYSTEREMSASACICLSAWLFTYDVDLHV